MRASYRYFATGFPVEFWEYYRHLPAVQRMFRRHQAAQWWCT